MYWERLKRDPERLRRHRARRGATAACDCGLCVVCGGFSTPSWALDVRTPDPGNPRVSDSSSDTDSSVDSQDWRALEAMLDASEEEDDLEPLAETGRRRADTRRRLRSATSERRLQQWRKRARVEVALGDMRVMTDDGRVLERFVSQMRREEEAAHGDEENLLITNELFAQLNDLLASVES